jgi:hypothetical protein
MAQITVCDVVGGKLATRINISIIFQYGMALHLLNIMLKEIYVNNISKC